MKSAKYTNDRTIQILIALLKAHHIRKVVASPGTTNAIFVASMQNDGFFEMYSCPDERSAAYMACGISQESEEPVIITCTEATASRNYYPALTEAFYRKLPILVITGFHSLELVGQLYPQAIDRSSKPNDTIKYSVNIESVRDEKDEWRVNYLINNAILELKKSGGGPVHINLQSSHMYQLTEESLPVVRVFNRITPKDIFPPIPSGKIAIIVGIHHRFSAPLTKAIENFCTIHNGVVFANNICGYHGKYKVNITLIAAQKDYQSPIRKADMVIHIGEIGAPAISSNEYWRVSEDGVARDTFKKLRYVFEMDEQTFFDYYGHGESHGNTYYEDCLRECDSIKRLLPDLPFSNAWIASVTHPLLPSKSIIHFGILNSMRVWNYFDLPDDVSGHCNIGGYGIDGGLSTLIGSSFVSKEKLHFGVFGDLAFFYDLNSLGNRHICNNIRIMLINNGKGQEFRNSIHPAHQLGEMADDFVAASGHNGNKSLDLVRNFVEALGFEYLYASSKEEFMKVLNDFVSPVARKKPMVLEIFVNGEDDSKSLSLLSVLMKSPAKFFSNTSRRIIHEIIGDSGIQVVRKILK